MTLAQLKHLPYRFSRMLQLCNVRQSSRVARQKPKPHGSPEAGQEGDQKRAREGDEEEPNHRGRGRAASRCSNLHSAFLHQVTWEPGRIPEDPGSDTCAPKAHGCGVSPSAAQRRPISTTAVQNATEGAHRGGKAGWTQVGTRLRDLHPARLRWPRIRIDGMCISRDRRNPPGQTRRA